LRSKFLLRPQEINNAPELVRHLGILSVIGAPNSVSARWELSAEPCRDGARRSGSWKASPSRNRSTTRRRRDWTKGWHNEGLCE
jgi:hypothetical protein